jgi:hypothetical protein
MGAGDQVPRSEEVSTEQLATELAGVPGTLLVSDAAFTSFQSTAAPFGGTAVGLVMDTRVSVVTAELEIPAEEYGIELVDTIHGGEIYAVTFAVRSWDPDAIKWSRGSAVGARTGKRYIDTGVAPKAGYRMSDAFGHLRVVFLPDDTANHPTLVMYRAIPRRPKTMEVQLQNRVTMALGMGFTAVRTAANPPVRWGMLADLTAPA